MIAGTSRGLSRREALRRGTTLLSSGGNAEAAGDARFLLLGLLDLDVRDLLLDGDRILDAQAGDALDAAFARRLAGEPVARILGAWEFWGLPFRLAPETLVPRPDTETLVAAALACAPDRAAPLRCLDLGTGSGCILVALLSELPQANGLGLDRSPAALRIARHNAVANGVGGRAAFAAGDWCDALRGGFDLVVSNPPYIVRHVIQHLDRDVRLHDPHAALDGGPDGLDAYRRILDGVRDAALLAPGGRLLLEIGYDQAEAVRTLGRGAGYADLGLRRDLAGHDRVLTFGLPFGHTDA
ncbi:MULTISPECIES: peptide chain release factor N(5)-glutamine methyltransferase [unclassified Methylobacterium]|uniref:peptide chain release factor N(5)-glutamine methyltransferase n=1 Tax=unclassified Methylobacterium TaxID=2615210 RepID=UPI0011C1F8EE|nr:MULTISPECIES: peptide chain release factor N(5)-glutamine methyltransferase [unclassified Methylobacterium]QEE37731.1 peptide chain release factor N(5)-glutamine methyltransferase [Methylobacterium sp. WL1]TXN56648.1 peptide chain release factor N(5)-glutamine methyltransferase [Methylobacterium sp. WL2]